MDKKPRLGSDPLGWIRDTRKDVEGRETGKPILRKCKRYKHSLHKPTNLVPQD